MDVEADVPHEWHQGVEDLGHTAAERGGAHVQHPFALEGGSELADLLDQPSPDEMRVVGEGPVA